MADVEVAGVFDSGQRLLTAVRAEAPDVVLLDVPMPDLGGIEVASLLEGAAAVIFVTAHPQFAVSAFDVDAVDYVLKPVEAGRLKAALERARTRLAATRPAAGEGIAVGRRLPVKTRQGVVLLDVAELTHAVLEDELVTLYAEALSWLSDWSLTGLEDALEQRAPGRFLRVSRQAIVNLDKVTLLEPQESGGYLAQLVGGGAVAVSRQAARQLRRDLGV
ncbi:MAG: DNA-binding response regulator [Deltaproteobacteria bacterium HGW-Deltaproteobacteria-14]|jgi:DNA-binding LytR/AlgR family response regulator|nr:MAG: DNA-binding response regulator [Deltaproteobacteria bacterium HGW-Deltaproteobacteria-14]